MKGYSNSLAIGELEIETRRHHFAPIKLKRLGGLESVQCGQERTDIRMFSCYSGECSTSSSEDPTLIHPIKYTHALWLGHFSPGWLYIPKKFLHTHEGARTKMSLAVCFMVTGTWQHLVSIPGGGGSLGKCVGVTMEMHTPSNSDASEKHSAVEKWHKTADA